MKIINKKRALKSSFFVSKIVRVKFKYSHEFKNMAKIALYLLYF